MKRARARALVGIPGGVKLALYATSETRTRKVWLWQDRTGQGYVTKIEDKKMYGWKLVPPNTSAKFFATGNRMKLTTRLTYR